MSISQLFPEEGPTLNLNFAGSRTLDPRITFTRTSTGTYMGSDGLIKVAPADSPRFDHRYVNGEIESLGLLVEEQRSNLFTYSEQFDNADWIKTRCSVENSSIIAPDGSTNAFLLKEDTSVSDTHTLYKVISFESGFKYSYSIFAKAYGSGNRKLFMLFGAGAFPSQQNATFDLVNGIVENVNTDNGSEATIEKYSNGWYKCTLIGKATTSSTTSTVISYLHNESTVFYTGDGSSGIYVWGAQLEQGSFPTSYIPRPDASTATRTPDNVSMVGENFSSWYNPTEGTIVLDCTPVYDNSSNQYRRLLSIHNNSGGQTDVIQFIQTEASNQVSSAVWDGSSFQSGFGKVVNSGTRYKVAFAVKENNMNASYDGSIGTDDTSATLPVMTEMDIGSYNNVYQATTHYNSLRYYPTRLPNSQLQTLTR